MVDIWFGPGGLRGVFGAGVAKGLHDAIAEGECDPSRLRLFGSSVGCLNAVYLATGNAGCGLDIFCDDVSQLICPSNLLPSLVVRLGNRMGRAAVGRRICRVPSVLNVDHVFTVMQQRTPNITQQIRNSPTSVFSEFVDRHAGEFRHEHLQHSDDPLGAIRNALNCFPFACLDDSKSLDSGIRGYGFVELLNPVRPRKIVAVLNEPATPRLRDRLGGIIGATLAASPSISGLYLRRQGNCSRAICLAQQSRQVLLLTPSRPVQKNQNGFLQAHAEGRNAAQQILRFTADAETEPDAA